MTDVTARLADASIAFVIALRSNEGFQQDLYDTLASVLRDCAREWRDSETVPKLATDILVGIVPTTEAAAYGYDEPERQLILDAGFSLFDLINEAVATDYHSGSAWLESRQVNAVRGSGDDHGSG